tara:strand:- start:22942 stop:24453 length:1512 start_codon:yes stop_codon:yes gene_type:complete
MRLNYKRSFINSLVIFGVLTLISTIFVFTTYQKDKSIIEAQSNDIIILQKERIYNHLDNILNMIQFMQTKFRNWDTFDEKNFDTLANNFLTLNPSALAFNYVNNENIIARVFPLHKNRMALGKDLTSHPDSEIKSIFLKGLDKDRITLTPPVDLYQGHRAIIFYAPVIFKDSSYGWLNILIQIDKTFENFLKVNAPLNSHISIIDKKSRRYLFNENSVGELSLKKEFRFHNRVLIFSNDISTEVSNLQERHWRQLGFIQCLIILLCITLYFYFKNNEKIIESFVSTKSERNLLRILFHDLTNPLSIVQLYALSLQEKYPSDPEVPKQLIKIQQMTEVITSIRHLDYLNREVKEVKPVKFNINELFENLLLLNKDLISKKNLNIQINNSENITKELRVPYELFKNEIVNNLFNNALKFSFASSEIIIEVSNEFIKITNKSEPIPSKVLKDINELKPTESKTEGIIGKGHGLGMFIAKILARKFELDLKITQDTKKKEVYTVLTF